MTAPLSDALLAEIEARETDPAPDDVRLLLREVRRLRAELQALPTPDDWEEFAAQALAYAIEETEWDLSDMEWGELEHLLRFEFHTQSPHRAAMDRP